MQIVIRGKTNPLVYAEETFLNPDGKPRKRIVKKYGHLDELRLVDPNILDKLREECERENARRRQGRDDRRREIARLAVEALKAAAGKQTDDGEPDAFPQLNLGVLVLRHLWSGVLGLDYKIKYLCAEDESAVKEQLNRTALFLTAVKAIVPSSLRQAWLRRENFLGAGMGSQTLWSLYRVYDFLAAHKDELLAHVNRRLDGIYGTGRRSLVFYDVTNVYFETSLTDEERGRLRAEAVRRELDLLQAYRKEYASRHGEDADGLAESAEEHAGIKYAADGTVADLAAVTDVPLVRQIREIRYLRQRGPSKEHRSDLPLVSVALVIDENAMPLDFQLYPGNCAEMSTMRDAVVALKKKYRLNQAVVVAGRSLNSARNLRMLLDCQLGFIVAQKVSTLSGALRKQMLAPDGYAAVGNVYSRCRAKVLHNFNRAPVGQEPLPCDLVVIYDEERAARDRRILEQDCDEARAAVKEQRQVKGNARRWTMLVKFDGQSPCAGELNDAAIAKRRELCGYAALVYHPAPGAEDAPDLSHIISTYHGLLRIEDCFRVMKSNLDLRPMYVFTENRIAGHVLCCVLALIMLRLLEERLQAAPGRLSMQQIVTALGDLSIQIMKGKDGHLLYTRTAKPSSLFCADVPGEEDLHGAATQCAGLTDPGAGSKVCSTGAFIFKALNLLVPPRCGTLRDLERSLKVHFPNEVSAVGKLCYSVA